MTCAHSCPGATHRVKRPIAPWGLCGVRTDQDEPILLFLVSKEPVVIEKVRDAGLRRQLCRDTEAGIA